VIAVVQRKWFAAVYVSDWVLAQWWLFWVAPIIGAVIGYKFLETDDQAE